MFLLCFYEELREATLSGEKRPVGVALRAAQLWLRDATLTDILGRVQVSRLDGRACAAAAAVAATAGVELHFYAQNLPLGRRGSYKLGSYSNTPKSLDPKGYFFKILHISGADLFPVFLLYLFISIFRREGQFPGLYYLAPPIARWEPYYLHHLGPCVLGWVRANVSVRRTRATTVRASRFIEAKPFSRRRGS